MAIHSESESDADLEFYDRIKKIKSKQDSQTKANFVQKGMLVEFSDFLEPKLMFTGHIIPLTGGHNGPMSKIEQSIYELHLTNAGFIQEPEMIVEDIQVQSEDDSVDQEEGMITGRAEMDVQEPDDPVDAENLASNSNLIHPHDEF